ncbi:tyrosine-protein phosphatase [Dermatobacter hominis]|uniref:tyrosine-protein phosphatase n=1 Tax=Dermatobacter hominis TaxID=2884263 RepID=UPI001D10FF1C|nr:tyrosine-protein phosphatase [Dermatobacter hominis]UDY37341.1 tyrosine-protein phosphatase [Dermatobacter hominis]
MPHSHLRPGLARDGIVNLRDLGGTPAADGMVVQPGLLIRADALQRCSADNVRALHAHGVRRVIDLRDDAERDEDGVFTVVDGLPIEVHHVPVVDPAYVWEVEGVELDQVLAHRYEDILTAFGDRFRAAVELVATSDGGVAYHCAVGKDRTGLLTLLLLGALGSPRDVIVDDYVRSARVNVLQVARLRVVGHRYGRASDDDVAVGAWSARPETMHATLDLLEREHGGVLGYLRDAGVDDEVVATLRARLLGPPGDGAAPDPA